MVKRAVRTSLAIAALIGAAGPAVGVGARAAASPCLVPGTGQPLDQLWRPNMAGAIAYAQTRVGDIALAVRTQDHFYGYRPDHVEWSASVVKAMLMVAYLNLPSVANRPLNGGDDALLVPMITQSDNNAATAVRDIVGDGGLQALASRVGMTNFATNPVWGLTSITARDQTLFFLHIDSFIPPRHRAYALGLLASITPSQRWGIGEVAPRGWQLYFKGGWGYSTGAVDHQVVLLVRGCARISLAVLTLSDGSHPYGKETLRGIFLRLLQGLPTGATNHGWTLPRTISAPRGDRLFPYYATRSAGEILLLQSVHRGHDTLATVPINGLAVGAPRRLVGPLGAGTIEDVAVGAGGRAVAVGVSGGAITAGIRFVGHRRFGPAQTLSAPAGSAGPPVVAMSSDGAAVAAWLTTGGPGAPVVAACVRPAGAGGFGPVQAISAPGASMTSPVVAISPDGVPTVVWADDDAVREATYGRGSFSAPAALGPAALSSGLHPTGHLALVSASGGRLLAAWGASERTPSGALLTRIVVAQGSVDGIFGPAAAIGLEASDRRDYGPVATITSRGTALVAYAREHAVLVLSGLAGAPLGSIQTIAAGRGGEPGELTLGTNAPGGVVLAWDERLSRCCGVTRVAVRRSGQNVFAAPIALSERDERPLDPAAALSSAGGGVVTWTRSGPASGAGPTEASLAVR